MLCYTKRGKETYPTDNRTVCSSDNTNTGPSPVGRVAPWWWPLLEVCKSHHICMSLEKCPFHSFPMLMLFYLTDFLSNIYRWDYENSSKVGIPTMKFCRRLCSFFLKHKKVSVSCCKKVQELESNLILTEEIKPFDVDEKWKWCLFQHPMFCEKKKC